MSWAPFLIIVVAVSAVAHPSSPCLSVVSLPIPVVSLPALSFALHLCYAQSKNKNNHH